MANSYTTIMLTTDRPIVPNLTGTDARDKAKNLATIFDCLASGALNGSFDLMTDDAKASGTITIDYSKIQANDTVTIDGTTFTCKASGATGAQFNKQTSATVTAANLVTAINANATINGYVTASSALGVVTITCNEAGTVGNTITLAKSENVSDSFTLSDSTLTGGLDGTKTTYSFGM